MEPKIRFKGFEGEWKASTIGDFCSVSIGEFVIKTKQNDNAPYPVYNGGSSYTGFYENYNQEGPKVIVSARGANAGFVNYCEKNFWAGNSCYSIATKDNRNLKFLYHCLKKNQSNYLNNQQAANIPSISKKDIQETILVMPKSFEQQAIASYFTSLDSQISAATSRLASLKQMKAASLQAMFPQEGETVPKIRFKGFEGKWKKVKFKEFGHVAMCKRIFKNQTTSEGDVPFYKIGTFGSEPDSYISQSLFEEYKKKYPFPNKGDILISAAGTIGRTVEYNGENCYYQDSNIVWLDHNNNITNGFLKQLYSIVKWSSLEGATIKRLYNSNILETTFYIPNINEQQAIASYFTSLDRQISLQSQRLEKLKQIKSACLDKMFV